MNNMKAETGIAQEKGDPLVSIITIVKNGEKYLGRTIRSVVAQTYKNIEYIVIDGKSTDGTLDIIKRNEQHISHWVSEEDKGVSDAFNKGLAAATGDLIGIINADDWYEPDALESVVKRLEEGDVFYGNNQYWKGDQKDYRFKADHHLLVREMTINHPTVFVKRKMYEQLGNFNIDYKCAMDYELLLRFYTARVKFVYLDQTIANMQLDGISDAQWKRGYKEVKNAKLKWLKTPKWKILLWYQKQLITIRLIKFLQYLRLDAVLRFYRKHFALIPKTKHKNARSTP